MRFLYVRLGIAVALTGYGMTITALGQDRTILDVELLWGALLAFCVVGFLWEKEVRQTRELLQEVIALIRKLKGRQ